ncbi:ergosterol biosynthesis protein [Coelomomyces lativittatus]|nr:ergosterol biosynthesis protein [Coelomomyces lativittatus]
MHFESLWFSAEKEWLPYWLMIMGTLSLLNSIGAFSNPKKFALQVYSTEVSELSGRIFGFWNILSAILRLTAARNIHDPILYMMAFFSFLMVDTHYLTEKYYFRTLGWNKVSLGAVTIACM